MQFVVPVDPSLGALKSFPPKSRSNKEIGYSDCHVLFFSHNQPRKRATTLLLIHAERIPYMSVFEKLFDTSDFPARWYCGNWDESLGWLHICSDIAIATAYFAIPVVLLAFARKRRDFPFHNLFWLFAAFIFACGTTHLIDAVIFWHPIYRISGLAKLFTAVISSCTVGVLLGYAPQVVRLPSLAKANERMRDEIRERQRIEQELSFAKARLEALVEGTRAIVLSMDPHGEFIDRQTSWEQYTGQAWDKHQGRGWLQMIHPEDQQSLSEELHLSLNENSRLRTTARLWHLDSKSYRRFVVDAVPVLDDSGRTVQWFGTIDDIEEQQTLHTMLDQAQAEVARQKRELELLYETAPVGMCLVDRQYRYVRINETLAQIYGREKRDLLHKKVQWMNLDFRRQIEPIYQEIFSTGLPSVNVEVVGRTLASPAERTWLCSYYPLHQTDESGQSTTEVVAVSAIVQDITVQKEQQHRLQVSEEAAHAANRAKSEFLANMSHEIRTPLAAIIGYADVVLDNLVDTESRNHIQTIKRNGEHLLDIVNDVLDLAQIEAEKLIIDPEPLDLPALIEDLLVSLQLPANEKGLELVVEYDGKIPKWIEADSKRLRQVLINLIGNAIKFSERGKVRLRMRVVGGEQPAIEFAVIDNGIGMDHRQISRLFQPFTQGDASISRRYGGTGLGLTISRRFVEMMGGTIEVESALGSGTTFQIRLPITISSARSLIEPESGTVTATNDIELPRLTCHVLVVDDRRDIRFLTQHFLKQSGARVEVAESAIEGIERARNARDRADQFDVIIMDMQMPEMDGLDATAILRSDGFELPIIALTADAMKGDRERCIQGGFTDYLPKPVKQQQLLETVAKYTSSP